MTKRPTFSSPSGDSISEYWIKDFDNETKVSTHHDIVLFSDSSLLSFPSEMYDPFSRKRRRFKDSTAKKKNIRDKSLDPHYKFTLNRMNKEDFRKRIVDLVMTPVLSGGESSRSITRISQLHHYVQTGVDTLHVTQIEESSLKTILILIPEKYQTNFPELMKILTDQIQDEFTYAIKRSIIEFTLNKFSTKESPEVF